MSVLCRSALGLLAGIAFWIVALYPLRVMALVLLFGCFGASPPCWLTENLAPECP